MKIAIHNTKGSFSDSLIAYCETKQIIVIGDKAFGIKRMIRENDFRAPGSGMIKYEKDNETAFVVPANEIDAMASKILYIMNNPDIATKVGQAGKNLASKEFYFINYAHKITEFFKSIAN
jgi:glycosyltransferase involved in cell wall biosynthesis